MSGSDYDPSKILHDARQRIAKKQNGKARYILNSAVITAPGTYCYDHISVLEMQNWMICMDWISTVGYAETAQALCEITGFDVSVNRKMIVMQPGDEALVFRLIFPRGYRPDPSRKGKLSVQFILDNSEIGLLRRLE